MSEEMIWLVAGHSVCISQWLGFILVDYACLGRRDRVRHPCLWAFLMALGMLAVSMRFDVGFFNVRSILLNLLYLLLSALLFGGRLPQKLMTCLINGTMCLLAENTVSFTYAWLRNVPTSQNWRNPGCLVALCLTNLITAVAVAYFARRWRMERALSPLQALVMSFFPGIVVVLNIVLMITGSGEKPTFLNILLTLGLTVAVLIHLCIVQMFNEQVVQQQELQIEAVREKESAEALLESYTTQRRLTHEFTNHTDALALLLQQEDSEGAKA